jgi:hypothetical protein
VALARPKPTAVAEPLPLADVASRPLPQPPRSSPLPLMATVPANGGYLRRCTFRRIQPMGVIGRRAAPSYEVSCLYPDRQSVLPLGDINSARAICDACAATGIFRPDED